jgi:hypothetical protein
MIRIRAALQQSFAALDAAGRGSSGQRGFAIAVDSLEIGAVGG